MTIRLVTLVGSHVDILGFMLKHYRAAGVEAFDVHVHLPHEQHALRDEVRAITEACGCTIASTVVGDWRTFVLDTWIQSMREHPDDWWILADQDELHHYPDRLPKLLAYCDRHGYDAIRGGLVDRLSADGRFPAVDASRPLSAQFPLGSLLTANLLGGNSMKIVAAKGRVAIDAGHHTAGAARPCPIRDLFVQVHHFKWTAGVIERQRERSERFRQRNLNQWVESARFVEHCEQHGDRIDLHDAQLLVAPCRPSYPYWHVYTCSVAALDKTAAAH